MPPAAHQVSDATGAPDVIDVERARADTPGCHDVIYLDNAGSSLPIRQVVDAQVEWLRKEATIGGYEMAATRDLDEVRRAVGGVVGAEAHEIALVSSATEAWELAFASIPLSPGDRILTSEAEYASNYIQFLHTAKRTGARVEVVPSDDDGATDADALASMLDERVRLIAISHMPTNGGLVNPAGAIGEVAAAAGIPFLLDACQTVGQLEIDVADLQCDLLTATGRKYLRGPRGTGFLYASPTFLDRFDPPFLDLHGATWTSSDGYEMRADARRYETWEFNHAALEGLGIAADYAMRLGIGAIESRVVALAARLRGLVEQIEGVTVHDLGVRRGAIVTFSHERVDAATVIAALAHRSITVSPTSPSSTLVDATRRRLPTMVRASVHYYNTEDELARFAASVSEVAGS